MSSQLTPRGLPAENLGDITRPNRGAGLAHLVNSGLPPRPTRDADEAPTKTPAPVDAATPTMSAPAPSPVVPAPNADAPRKPGRPRTRPKPTSAVYVSSGVKKRFEKYRHDSKLTNLTVILKAISAKHKAEELEGIIEKSRYSTAPEDDLFPSDPSAVRYLGGGNSPIAFSATTEQAAKIDEIGKELGFETRSTWIAPVLNDFLPGKKDAPTN